MQRTFLNGFAVILFVALALPCYCADSSAFLSQAEVNHHGLHRAWHSQVNIDGRMTTIEHAQLDRGMFFIVTSNCDMIALDAETGKTLWSRHVTNTGLKPFAPAANTRTVAVVCGDEVSVFDRRNGRLLWHQVLPASPTSACQLTDYYLYVPLIDQRVVCYSMEELKAPSPGLLNLVPQYKAIGYTLDPYSGKVTKADNLVVNTEELVISQRGEKKPAPSKRLQELVPEYAKIGMVLNPYTGEIAEASRPVASWWRENLIDANMPLKGKTELDTLLEEELIQLQKSQRMERMSGQPGIDDGKDADAPYYLKPLKSVPLFCNSFGTALDQPVISYDSSNIEILTWFTDRGYLFFAQGLHSQESHDRDAAKDSAFALQYKITVTIPLLSYMSESKIGRFEGSIVRDVAFQPAVIQKNPDDDSSRFLTVVGSASGLVFAFDPMTSETRWWQSLGSPISNRPTVVKDKIYVPCLDGNFCCLDSQQGDLLWRSPGIDSFIMASPDRVYVKSTFGDLVAINPKDGAQTTLFSVKDYKDVYYNNENDRIYLISNSGLIQCLHETGRVQPVRHTFLPDAYLNYSETPEERRHLITMPEIPGATRRKLQQSGLNDTPKTQSSPGMTQPDDTLFGSGDDTFDAGNLFGGTPSTPVTPATTKQQPQDESQGFDDFDIDFSFE